MSALLASRETEGVLVGDSAGAFFFRDARRTQHFEHVDGAHASHSSIFLTASEVTTTVSAPTSATGSDGPARRALPRRTAGCAPTGTGSRWRPRSRSAGACPRRGPRASTPGRWSSARRRRTPRRPWEPILGGSADRIDTAIAARVHLAVDLLLEMRGLNAKVTPPPTKIGAVSHRAGAAALLLLRLLVVPLTSANASSAPWCRRGSSIAVRGRPGGPGPAESRPKTASETDSVLPLLMASSIVIVSLCLADGRTITSAAAFGARDRAADRDQAALGVDGPPAAGAGGRFRFSMVARPCGRTSSCPGTRGRGLALADRTRQARCDSELPCVASPMREVPSA